MIEMIGFHFNYGIKGANNMENVKEVKEVYEAICELANRNTDFEIGFDHLFEFMAENPGSETTKGFIQYHVYVMQAPKTHDGRPEFTYLIGKPFVPEQWVSEVEMYAFQEYVDKER